MNSIFLSIWNFKYLIKVNIKRHACLFLEFSCFRLTIALNVFFPFSFTRCFNTNANNFYLLKFEFFFHFIFKHKRLIRERRHENLYPKHFQETKVDWKEGVLWCNIECIFHMNYILIYFDTPELFLSIFHKKRPRGYMDKINFESIQPLWFPSQN